MVRRYIKNILIAIDQLIGAICGLDPDETISSFLGKTQRGDFGRTAKVVFFPFRFIVDFIFRILGDENHCARFAVWMDSVYQYCYQVMNDVISGVRRAPTIEQLISELPKFSWEG